MTAIHDIATKLATAVVDRIETDRCCNTANIGDAILRELAVAALSPMPGNARTPERLLVAARNMTYEIRAHSMLGSHTCFDSACLELEAALRELDAL